MAMLDGRLGRGSGGGRSIVIAWLDAFVGTEIIGTAAFGGQLHFNAGHATPAARLRETLR